MAALAGKLSEATFEVRLNQAVDRRNELELGGFLFESMRFQNNILRRGEK